MAKATTRNKDPVKMCLNPSCHKVLPLTEFYKNRNWIEQNGVDLYCKECARKMCVDRDSMRKYCWENNRLWKDEMWAAAEKRAMRYLANTAEWLSEKTTRKRKAEIRNKAICNQFFFVMNLANYYCFNENGGEDGALRDFDPDSTDGMLIYDDTGEVAISDGTKLYSPVWNGLYTKPEIEFLDNYYAKLEEDFVLDDVSIQDYARKICKASLLVDIKYNQMRANQCTQKEWQEAQSAFDGLCKSTNFAACQRKDKSTANNKVICEIVAMIEIEHHASMPKVEFPPDDIDRILADFAHTDVAIQ